MRSIEFFFDFLSPFSYLAHCRLPALAKLYGYELVYKPFNMFEAKKATGNTGPATPHIPFKFLYICTDLRRWADRYGVSFSMPWAVASNATMEELKNIKLPDSGLDTTRVNKAMFFAIDRGQAQTFAEQIWGGSFGSNGLVGSETLLIYVAHEMGWSPDELQEFIESDEALDRYRATTIEAINRGVFGAPTMIVDDEMWWGNDRLDLVEEYLAKHQTK